MAYDRIDGWAWRKQGAPEQPVPDAPTVPNAIVRDMIDNAYAPVRAKLPVKVRARLPSPPP